MKTIGRKTYIRWGDHIVAVEILVEKPEEFEARNGFVVENGKSYVCEVADVFGERVERPIGNILIEPNYTETEHLGQFLSQVKMISQNDLDAIVKQMPTPTDLIKEVKLNKIGKWMEDYNKETGTISKGFIGFIQLTENTILKQFCPLSQICFTGEDNKPYIPVYLLEEKGKFFDSNDDDSAEKPFIIFFHGTDNCSYGERFETFEEANKFISKGFACSLNKKLRFFNS